MAGMGHRVYGRSVSTRTRLPAPGRETTGSSAPARTGIVSLPPPVATNPYQRLLYEQLERHGLRLEPVDRLRVRWLWSSRRRVRVLHFHWPQVYYHDPRVAGILSWPRLALFIGRLGAARMLGYRVAWTVHQVYPHESPSRRLDRLAGRALAAASDVLIAHDRVTAAAAAELRPRRPVEVLPHPAYTDAYPPGRERADVRAALGVPDDAFTFLCFGHLRAYKEVGLLLDAFAGVDAGPVALIVAGLAVDPAAAAAVRAAAAGDHRIVPLLEFVPDDRVAELHAAADAAVVARSDGGTSGALALALTMGVPVVAASAYADQIGTAGWMFRPGDAGALRAALETAAADPDGARRRVAALAAPAQGWDEFGARTAQLFTREPPS
jgi:beta-1,4-mannosyltransferase